MKRLIPGGFYHFNSINMIGTFLQILFYLENPLIYCPIALNFICH